MGTWPLGFCPASTFLEFWIKWLDERNFLLYRWSCVELLPHWNCWVAEGFWNGLRNPSFYSSLTRPPYRPCLLLIEMIGQELGTSLSPLMSCGQGYVVRRPPHRSFAFRCYLAIFLPLQCRNPCQLHPSSLCPNTPLWCVSVSHISWICQKCFHRWKHVYDTISLILLLPELNFALRCGVLEDRIASFKSIMLTMSLMPQRKRETHLGLLASFYVFGHIF